MSVMGGTGVAAASTRASRDRAPQDDPHSYAYLAGDHHIHTQFSSDAKYRPHDQAFQAAKYGLDWMVITDHGSAGHAKFGVDKVNPDIRAARAAIEDALVFQGLEWNIPAAEHGTVFVHPGEQRGGGPQGVRERLRRGRSRRPPAAPPPTRPLAIRASSSSPSGPAPQGERRPDAREPSRPQGHRLTARVPRLA